MTTLEALLAAAIAASDTRRMDALRPLRGEAQLADPLEPKPMKAPLLLGMGQAAKYIGVSRPTLWRMIQAGKLEKVEVLPGSHRLRRSDVEGLALKRRNTSKNQN